jgi:hypothetical protein
MSDTTSPDLSDASLPNGSHPSELLAGYVDGSATTEEREAAERHLSSCARCAVDVELARSARVALLSLPELEAPGLAERGIAALGKTGDADTLAGVTPISAAGRRVRWDRVAWAAGLAAAAALVVVFSLAVLHVGNNRQTSTAAGPAPATKGPVSTQTGLPPIVNKGTDYTPQSLAALGTQLGQTDFAPARPPGFQSQGAADVVSAAAILTCLQQGSGLDASATPRYLEVADYQGTPAFVGAFVLQPPAGTGSKSHLLLVVVSRDGCQPITVLRQPL